MAIPPASALAPPQLTCDSKAAAVAILKTSSVLDGNTKAMLKPSLVTGILAAEAERMALWEKAGVDWETVGPGQLGKLAYTDVTTRLRSELSQFLLHMGATCGASLFGRGCGVSKKPLVLRGYPQDVVVDPVVVDFFIAAYLALCILGSAKAGRSADDQLRYGIGRYHGAFDKMFAAQKAISPADSGASVVAFPPVKRQMESSSDSDVRDVAAYIDEVCGCPARGCGPCRSG